MLHSGPRIRCLSSNPFCVDSTLVLSGQRCDASGEGLVARSLGTSAIVETPRQVHVPRMAGASIAAAPCPVFPSLGKYRSALAAFQRGAMPILASAQRL